MMVTDEDGLVLDVYRIVPGVRDIEADDERRGGIDEGTRESISDVRVKSFCNLQ